VLFLVDHRLQFSGKKVGIIGLAIAKRVEAFDCPVNYYQRTKQAYPSYTYYPSVVEQAASSDVLVVACPLNEHVLSSAVPLTLELAVATKGYVIGRLRVWNARLLYSPAAAAPSRLVSHTVLAVMPPEACIAFLLRSY
jgi:lactate dehydrogenase-like 2-hydroxyacid dehydrogenase